MEEKYLVTVTNEILGNSQRVMTKDQLRNFNQVTYRLSKIADVEGGEQTSGMWSVKKLDSLGDQP